MRQVANAPTETDLLEMLGEIEFRDEQLRRLEDVLDDVLEALHLEVVFAENRLSKRKAQKRRKAISKVFKLFRYNVVWQSTRFVIECRDIRDILFNNVSFTEYHVLRLYKYMTHADCYK